MKRDFAKILDQAHDAAAKAVENQPDTGTCGFAWVETDDRALMAFCKKALFFSGGPHDAPRMVAERWYGHKHWRKGWQFWNPGFYAGQSIDAIEKGADAFTAVLRANGIVAYTMSRMD